MLLLFDSKYWKNPILNISSAFGVPALLSDSITNKHLHRRVLKNPRGYKNVSIVHKGISIITMQKVSYFFLLLVTSRKMRKTSSSLVSSQIYYCTISLFSFLSCFQTMTRWKSTHQLRIQLLEGLGLKIIYKPFIADQLLWTAKLLKQNTNTNTKNFKGNIYEVQRSQLRHHSYT